jgi:2-iminobutanoate/2-iminopropanoate deaminase
MVSTRAGFFAGLVLGVVAVAAAAAVEAQGGKRAINLPGRTTPAPFSDAVMVGDTLYLAGRLGLDPETGRLPASVAQEVRNILDGMSAVLAEAGMIMDDLVSVQVFTPDVSHYAEFNRAYVTYFGDAPPARAFVGSGPLLFGARFEIMGIAAR